MNERVLSIDDEGWIKLHRKSVHSQVFQSEGLWKLWSWCLLRANHKDAWISIKTGRGTAEVLVKRGEFLFGRKSAAKALKKNESTIYKRMMKLKSMGNLDIKSNTHYSIVTIINYELYQGSEKDEVTPKVTPKEHPSNTNKNDKNEKKKDSLYKKERVSSSKGETTNQSPSNGFEEFWSLYPHKDNKQGAMVEWANISPDDALFERIMGSLRRFGGSEEWQRDGGRFVPHADKWLRDARWQDTGEGEVKSVEEWVQFVDDGKPREYNRSTGEIRDIHYGNA